MNIHITSDAAVEATPLLLVPISQAEKWRAGLVAAQRNWLDASGFSGKVRQFALFQNSSGEVESAVAVYDSKDGIWALAHLPAALPVRSYRAELFVKADLDLVDAALGWQLATYHYTQSSKVKPRLFASLVLAEGELENITALSEGIFLARTLINRPANDLTPEKLAEEAEKMASTFGAEIRVIRDDKLLEENYPLIHAVGRASDNRPCLVDLRWGNPDHPAVTLVGKGICFDSGGLDIKPASGMKMMKKDMGGAATVLGLAQVIMATGLPVKLRVLIPAAENSISANAFRPMDVIRSRKGLTIEIGNTDAEGRLVLADALTEADGESPDLLIDFATLTGAARVAVGTDIPAFFTNDEDLAVELQASSVQNHDPLWRLPLFQGYRDMLNSDMADLNSAPDGGYAGAITAALFLKEFVERSKAWAHIDLMAWNLKGRPGRPVGGEAMGLRAVYSLLRARYGENQRKGLQS